MTTWLRVLLVSAAFALPACFDAEPDLGKMHFACQFDTDCLDGYKCRQHDVGKYCTPYTELVDVSQPNPDTTGGDAATE